MLKTVGLTEIERIFAVTDALGISREALVIPLRAEHPGRGEQSGTYYRYTYHPVTYYWAPHIPVRHIPVAYYPVRAMPHDCSALRTATSLRARALCSSAIFSGV